MRALSGPDAAFALAELEERCADLKSRGRVLEKKGIANGGIATNFPRNLPPPGLVYSRNFSRFLKYGIFASQHKD